MKRLIVCIVFISFISVYCFGDGIVDATLTARQHAETDTVDYDAARWGWDSYFISLLLGPLLGGIIMISSANKSGEEPIPVERLVWVNDKYADDSSALFVYQDTYENAANKIRRDANFSAAINGTLWGFVTLSLVVLIYYVKLTQDIAAAYRTVY